MSSGEEKAWGILAGLDPESVCRNASVSFAEGVYILKSLGMDFSIDVKEKTIKGLDADAENLLKRLSYFFNHSALWYLTTAKEAGLTGRLLRPSDVKGGHHFFRGTHELPLDKLAEKCGDNKEEFLERASSLGGRALSFGDASAELLPLPRIPVTLILHLGDEEFPPKAELFFDSTCDFQITLDIIWSTAMLTVLAMIL